MSDSLKCAVVVAVAMLATATGCGSSASTTQPAPSTHERTVAWRLGGVRDGGRTIVVRYDAGGCLRGDGRPVVSESDARVIIRVREHEVPHSGKRRDGVRPACSDVWRLKTLKVELQAPLAHRAIAGGPRLPSVTDARPVPLH